MSSAWPTRSVLIAGLILVLLGLHHQTFLSMAQSWISNSTYNHGFAIPLIAAFFAWQRRGVARDRSADVWWLGLVCVAALSGLWAIATLINVQVIAQLASVAIVSAIVLSMAGPTQALVFALPLGYLLFAVPFGEGIVPLLMVWTADFTVGALDFVGIPVVRDGLFFSIPSGNFEVAKACSGVRYLLASAAAGFAFAFITYNGWKKRLVFILAALIVPIVANGLRAVGIVLIAHYSEMRFATGIDHFIYGWFFFSMIILAMFLVGGHFADSHVGSEISLMPAADAEPFGRVEEHRRLGFTALLIVLLMAAGPAFVQYRAYTVDEPRPSLPEAAELGGRWSGPVASELDWQLDFKGAETTIAGAYRGSDATVQVRIAAYGNQTQGAELVNSENRIAREDRWRIIDQGLISVPSKVIPVVRAARISAAGQSYLVWYWFQQGRETTTSNYSAKWLEMMAIPNPSPAMVLAVGVSAPYDEAQQVLAGFLQDAAAALRDCVASLEVTSGCVMPEVPASKP